MKRDTASRYGLNMGRQAQIRPALASITDQLAARMGSSIHEVS